jgi:hypothetical protein
MGAIIRFVKNAFVVYDGANALVTGDERRYRCDVLCKPRS